ncbi:hypothetical protein ACVWZV_004697 [Bradyrhizobium sp. GM5.1]
MQTGMVNTARLASSAFSVESRNGRPDFDLAAALQKVSPKQQAKAQKIATDFEAMFLNSMFSQMDHGPEGRRPVRRHAWHRCVALDADRAIFQKLRQRRRRRHRHRRLSHPDHAAGKNDPHGIR